MATVSDPLDKKVEMTNWETVSGAFVTWHYPRLRRVRRIIANDVFIGQLHQLQVREILSFSALALQLAGSSGSTLRST